MLKKILKESGRFVQSKKDFGYRLELSSQSLKGKANNSIKLCKTTYTHMPEITTCFINFTLERSQKQILLRRCARDLQQPTSIFTCSEQSNIINTIQRDLTSCSAIQCNLMKFNSFIEVATKRLKKNATKKRQAVHHYSL